MKRRAPPPPPPPRTYVRPLITLAHVSLQVDLLMTAVRDAIGSSAPLEPEDIDFLNRQISECIRFLDHALDPPQPSPPPGDRPWDSSTR